MSFRTDMLATVDALRSIRGPMGFDIQMVQLTIRQRTWSGGRRGAGAPTDVDLVLPKHYRCKPMTEKQVASSNGRYEMSDLRIGPITPSFSTGGFTPAQLKPAGSTGVEIIYVLTGTTAGDYELTEANTEKAFSYFLVLRRMRTTP